MPDITYRELGVYTQPSPTAEITKSGLDQEALDFAAQSGTSDIQKAIIQDYRDYLSRMNAKTFDALKSTLKAFLELHKGDSRNRTFLLTYLEENPPTFPSEPSNPPPQLAYDEFAPVNLPANVVDGTPEADFDGSFIVIDVNNTTAKPVDIYFYDNVDDQVGDLSTLPIPANTRGSVWLIFYNKPFQVMATVHNEEEFLPIAFDSSGILHVTPI